MADYAGEQGQAALFGAPGAPRVSEQRGVLSQRLAGHPFGVLLLDELEKAHARVHDGFLQLVDEGRFINGRAEVVSVTSLIVIATSNAGSEVYREKGHGFARPDDLALLDKELDRRLRDKFRLEFLNRFDRVVHFHPLNRSVIRGIARRELRSLAAREGLAGRGVKVEIAPEVEDWLAERGYHPHYGARFLRREVERHVTGALAEQLVRHPPAPGTRLRVEVRDGAIAVRQLADSQDDARDAAR
jgi:ATP-dependent Clp protease ATP-binding subunit ClpC